MRQSLYDYCTENDKKYLLTEWDTEKNLPLTPREVSYGSKQKLWWRCGKGHEWQTPVFARTSDSGCPYCRGRRVEQGKSDLASLRPDLAGEWSYDKNGALTPDQVSKGSRRRVWWRCEKGHEWRATVKSRSGGSGCPICANKVIAIGENDLATTHPELARQWDGDKNGALTPVQVLSGSCKKVWWRCEKGHSWQAAISSRARGSGCPVCAGKTVVPDENDLASAFPDIAAQWHPTKNGKLTPQACTPASNRRVWWICPLGHEYQAAIGARSVNGSDCPYCAGKKVLKGFNDLATLEPKVAAQWHPTLNGNLTPEMVTVGSARKVWWQCAEGHVWKALIYSRTGAGKCGCPACAGKVKKSRQVRYVAAEASAQNSRTAISAERPL